MHTNKYKDYGKVAIGGDDALSFGIERYHNLLQEADESRQFESASSTGSAKKNRPDLATVWQFLAQLF